MLHLSKFELKTLLTKARTAGDRDWLMILVAYWHGMRASEVTSLTWDDVRDGMITVRRLKGSLKTRQPLIASSDPLLNEVAGFAEFSRRGDKIFPISSRQFQNIMHKHGAAAGIAFDLCHPHILKHSIAMHTVAQAGVENLRVYLGHKSLSSTGAYLKIDDQTASKAISAAAGI